MRYKLKYAWTPQGQAPSSWQWWIMGYIFDEPAPPYVPRPDSTFSTYLEADMWAKWKLSLPSVRRNHQVYMRDTSNVFHYVVEAVDIP